MSAIVPRDIARKLEQRWSARVKQDESFHARAERLKRDSTPCVEGMHPAPPQSDEAPSVPLSPALPVDPD
jgi:hypothetical protein